MDDKKQEKLTEAVPDGSALQDGEPSKKRDKKKKIIIGVVAAVVVVAVGFWVWHNNPSFCNNPVCHDSMNSYVETYNQQDGMKGVDKWGNEVSDSHAMLVVSHKGQNVACLGCHVPSISQQIGEVGIQLSGSYEKPLAEVNALDLLTNANKESASGLGDEFCMNGACHSGQTRDSLKQMFSGKKFNPHSWQHGQNQCTDCHKSHRASVLVCTECHNGSDPKAPDATKSIPNGWIDYDTAKELQYTAFS